jgi:tRNA-binding protein
MKEIDYDTFQSVELRVGTVIKAQPFPEARKPAHKVWVDFGEKIGVKQTSAQITINYEPSDLIGRQVIGCLNLGTMKIAGFKSEFLLTGFRNDDLSIVLIGTDKPVPNGGKLH